MTDEDAKKAGDQLQAHLDAMDARDDHEHAAAVHGANARSLAAEVIRLRDRVEALERALREEIACESGAPDEARCGRCRACERLRAALEGEP